MAPNLLKCSNPKTSGSSLPQVGITRLWASCDMDERDKKTTEVEEFMVAGLGKFLTKGCSNRPIFVVGTGRSGTSILVQALGKHPLILSMPGEAPFINYIGTLPYPLEFGEVKDYYVKSLQIPKELLYESLRRLCFESAAGRNYGIKKIIKAIVRLDFSSLRKRYWCAKTFPSVDASKGLMQLYPEAKFLYIIRHGCEVVQSRTRFHGFRQQNFIEHCRAWSQSIEKYRYLADLESAIEIRHEQLAAQPERMFQKIFTFIGVNYHDSPADFTKTTLIHPLDMATEVGVRRT
jgi:hypothetical protein